MAEPLSKIFDALKKEREVLEDQQQELMIKMTDIDNNLTRIDKAWGALTKEDENA